MDQNEAEKFDARADNYWEPSSPMAVLRKMNPLRVPYLVDSLKNIGVIKDTEDEKKPLKGLKILDVGCGGGFLSEELSKLGGKVTGIDGVPKVIEVARAHAALDEEIKDLTYIAEPIQIFTSKNLEKYDVVVMSEVLEHIVDKDEAIECVAKCLKPGGSLILTTVSKTFLSNLLTIYLLEYIVGALVKGIHDTEMYITPEDLEKLLKKNNCIVKDVRGIFYNFFTGNWRYMPFKTFYVMHAVKNRTKRSVETTTSS